jgi:hypothetical protein
LTLYVCVLAPEFLRLSLGLSVLTNDSQLLSSTSKLLTAFCLEEPADALLGEPKESE